MARLYKDFGLYIFNFRRGLLGTRDWENKKIHPNPQPPIPDSQSLMTITGQKLTQAE